MQASVNSSNEGSPRLWSGRLDRKSPVHDLYTAARIQQIEEAAIEMEWNGFSIDVPYLNAQAAIAREDHDRTLADLRDRVAACGIPPLGGIDDVWGSPTKLVQLLHDSPMGLRTDPSPYWFKGRVKLDDGERKTDRVALEWLHGKLSGGTSPDQAKGAVVESLMGLRRIISSLKYLEKLPRYVGPDGFVHPVCGPAGDDDDRVGAVTGRFGLKKPEAHQIPADGRKDLYHIRRGFIAPPGMRLISIDFSALEVVILANICNWLFGDRLLLDLTAPGQDIHAYNAHRVFGKFLGWKTPSGRPVADFEHQALFKSDPELAWFRDAIKAVWYKLQYGGTSHGFATSLKTQAGEPVGKARAEEIVEALYASVPSIPKWQKFVGDCLEQHAGIGAIDGRWVDYSTLINRGTWGMSAASRKGQNFPMQASGAHIIGCAMVDVMNSPELAKLGGVMQLQIHDELMFRAPADNCTRVLELGKEIMALSFPMENLRATGGIGNNWSECK